MSALAANQPSVVVATLPPKCMAFGFGNKIVIGRYLSSDDATPDPINSIVIDDGQVVRGLAFLRIPDGPVCLVSVGDGKYVNVYNISSYKEDNPEAWGLASDDDRDDAENRKQAGCKEVTKNDLEAKKWVPSYRFGPHAKRITHVVATNHGTVMFGDKFGEVYRLNLGWSPEHTIEALGDSKAPAEFLLQHFSVLTKMHVTTPVPRLDPIASSELSDSIRCRRLFTCDRDRHARVSRYPETYQVEQFLWTKAPAQSVVTCIAEIPYLSDEDFTFPETAGAVKRDRKYNAPYSYYVTGHQDGRVHFWAASNTLPMDSPLETFHCFGHYKPEGGLGPVVSVVYLAQDTDMVGNLRHPRDTPRGVVLAFEKSKDVFFYPVFDSVGDFGMHFSKIGGTVATLPDLPVSMVPSNDCTAICVLRNGAVALVRLVEAGYLDEVENYGDRPKLCSFNGNIYVELETVEEKMPFLVEKIQDMVTVNGKNLLKEIDLCAQWQSEHASTGLKHTRPENSDDSEDENEAEAAPEKKRSRSQKK